MLLQNQLIVYDLQNDAKDMLNSVPCVLTDKSMSEDKLEGPLDYKNKSQQLLPHLLAQRLANGSRYGHSGDLGQPKITAYSSLALSRWSPPNLLLHHSKANELVSFSAIALLRSNGTLSLCGVIDNSLKSGIEELVCYDTLVTKKSNKRGPRLIEMFPMCLAWSRKKKGQSTVFSVGCRKSNGCICFVAVEPNGSGSIVSCFDNGADENDWTTCVVFEDGEREDDLLFTGQASNQIKIWKVAKSFSSLEHLQTIQQFAPFPITNITVIPDDEYFIHFVATSSNMLQVSRSCVATGECTTKQPLQFPASIVGMV